MKAETCPTCMVPIMSKSNKFSTVAAGAQEICVGCGTDYKKDKNVKDHEEEPIAEEEDSYEEMIREYDQIADAASAEEET